LQKPKSKKLWESGTKAEKVCQKLIKYENLRQKLWKSAENVYKSLQKVKKIVGEIVPEAWENVLIAIFLEHNAKAHFQLVEVSPRTAHWCKKVPKIYRKFFLAL